LVIFYSSILVFFKEKRLERLSALRIRTWIFGNWSVEFEIGSRKNHPDKLLLFFDQHFSHHLKQIQQKTFDFDSPFNF